MSPYHDLHLSHAQVQQDLVQQWHEQTMREHLKMHEDMDEQQRLLREQMERLREAQERAVTGLAQWTGAGAGATPRGPFDDLFEARAAESAAWFDGIVAQHLSDARATLAEATDPSSQRAIGGYVKAAERSHAGFTRIRDRHVTQVRRMGPTPRRRHRPTRPEGFAYFKPPFRGSLRTLEYV